MTPPGFVYNTFGHGFDTPEDEAVAHLDDAKLYCRSNCASNVDVMTSQGELQASTGKQGETSITLGDQDVPC